MSRKFGKELLFFVICLVIGTAFAVLVALLVNIGVLPAPENEISVTWWMIAVLIGVALLTLIGIAVASELLRKKSKKYANDENDERNQIILGKAGYKVWMMNIFIHVMSGGSLFLSGHYGLALIFWALSAIHVLAFWTMLAYYRRKM